MTAGPVPEEDLAAYGFDPADLDDDPPANDGADTESAGDAGEKPRRLVYPTVDRFVTELLAPTYRRKVDGRTLTWCPQWWKHPEAIVRLEALWRSWEHLRLDPALGMSVWLRDHLDHHMPVLTDTAGPFRGCSPERGHGQPLPSLPLDEPAPGVFSQMPIRTTPNTDSYQHGGALDPPGQLS